MGRNKGFSPRSIMIIKYCVEGNHSTSDTGKEFGITRQGVSFLIRKHMDLNGWKPTKTIKWICKNCRKEKHEEINMKKLPMPFKKNIERAYVCKECKTIKMARICPKCGNQSIYPKGNKFCREHYNEYYRNRRKKGLPKQAGMLETVGNLSSPAS